MSALSLLPSKTVLFISDEAVHVYSRNNKVSSISWDDENFQEKLSDIIVNRCKKAPVMFLNDMVEQHYRKEKVPRVSPMDKANMMNRKLAISFPNYPIRAALKLKEKAQQVANAVVKVDNYIFAALPPSEQFSKSLDAVENSLCSISSYTLLPIEASAMVKSLSDKLLKKSKEKNKAKWCVFMAQHESGGLRQIVTRNGELALTRMSPIVSDMQDIDAWTREVAQEFKSTMSYVSRFGFSENDSLHVIAIGDDDVKRYLETQLDQECIFDVVTVKDSAKMLGLTFFSEENVFYADILHVAWVLKQRQHVLPMQSKDVERISKPRQAAAIAIFILFLAAFPQVYQIYDSQTELSEVQSNLENQNSLARSLEAEYQNEVANMEQFGVDFHLLKASLAIYENLQSTDVDLDQIVGAISQSIDAGKRINALTLLPEKEKTNVASQAFDNMGFDNFGFEEEKSDLGYDIRLTMTYPAQTDIDVGSRDLKRIRNALAAVLSNYDVEIEKGIRDYRYVDDLVIGAGQKSAQDFPVSILISGPREKQ